MENKMSKKMFTIFLLISFGVLQLFFVPGCVRRGGVEVGEPPPETSPPKKGGPPQKLARLKKVVRPPGRQLMGTVLNINIVIILLCMYISILGGRFIFISKEINGVCQLGCLVLSDWSLPIT
jgi:hypothetical protein